MIRRRMPWNDEHGRPVYICTDNPDGLLSRMADRLEAEMTANAQKVLVNSRELLASENVSAEALRFAIRRLSECLMDVLRIAEIRGDRLSGMGSGKDG